MTDQCGNCGKIFDGSFSLSQTLKILDFRSGEEGKNAPEEIPISSALSLIYSQFKYDCAEEDPVAFCRHCAHTVTVIYNAFKEFLYLRQSDPNFETEIPSTPRKTIAVSKVNHYDTNKSNKQHLITSIAEENEGYYEQEFQMNRQFVENTNNNSFTAAEDEIDVTYEISTIDDHSGRNIHDNQMEYEQIYNPYNNFENENDDEDGLNMMMVTNARSLLNESQSEEEEDEFPDLFIVPDNVQNKNDKSVEDSSGSNINKVVNHGPSFVKRMAMARQKKKGNGGAKRKTTVVEPRSRPKRTPRSKSNRSASAEPEETVDATVKNNHSSENTCCYCGKYFLSRKSIGRHIKIIHANKLDSKFSCHVAGCGAHFSQKVKLESHLLAHDIQLYKCDECDKSFTHGHSLKDHKVIHTDPERVTCRFCVKIFSRQNDLKRYLAHVHNKQIQSEVDAFVEMPVLTPST